MHLYENQLKRRHSRGIMSQIMSENEDLTFKISPVPQEDLTFKIPPAPPIKKSKMDARLHKSKRYNNATKDAKNYALEAKSLDRCTYYPLCDQKLNPQDLKQHEAFCSHRKVDCPSKFRNACSWTGPLSKLSSHVAADRCIEVICNESGTESTFKSSLGDFPAPQMSVFKRTNVITHWRPVLLISKATVNLWLYVIILRDPRGFWTLQVHSLLPEKEAELLRIKLIVWNSQNTGQKFTFDGKVISQDLSKEEGIKTGQFLLLHDCQIKNMCGKTNSTKHLFEYSVEVSTEKLMKNTLKI